MSYSFVDSFRAGAYAPATQDFTVSIETNLWAGPFFIWIPAKLRVYILL